MARFRDQVTGNVLEAANAFTVEQYRKYPARYREEQEQSHEAEATENAVETEPEERPAKRAGRPKKAGG